jgi:hypothetical protein
LPERWENEFRERPANHQYCYGLIHLFLELVLHAATSLGAASRVLNVMRLFLPWVGSIPTADCGQFWMLRVGLYEVTRPKEISNDRVWIVDHTIQIGTTKCLLVVGVSLSWWQEKRGPLSHQDLEVLALEPVETSNGEVVNKQLGEIANKVGVPRAIVGDQGTDITRGIESFQADHPETARIYDIAHKVANFLKQELKADPKWSEFLTQMGQTKQRLQQTALAFLTPPTPKSKARDMNLEILVNWGTNTLAYLDNPRPVTDEPIDKKQLREKLGWLRKYRERLVRWHAMMRIVATTLEYIREEGYHPRAAKELRRQLKPLGKDPQSHRLKEKILAFVKEQSGCTKKHEHLIGSSECIESLIGKGKRLEAQQSKSGFTRMVLGMAAAVVKPTKEYIEQAMANVKTDDVTKWGREKLGISVQSQRRQAFACANQGTKPG